MKHSDFPQANQTLNPAAGDEASVDPLRVCASVDDKGSAVRISCWEPTFDDLERLAAGGKVWLWVAGEAAHPPVLLTTEDPFAQTEPPEDISIDRYGTGFMIADYRNGGARYCGESLSWSNQPVILDPFGTEAEAIAAAHTI